MIEDCDNMILDVVAAVLEDKQIRLKYVAISGGCGPEIIMDVSLAEQTIDKLQQAILKVKEV